MRFSTLVAPFSLLVLVACGGTEVGTGAIDTSTGADAGGNGNSDSSSESAPSGCTPACDASQICVKSQFNGGPLIVPDDAGTCPTGRHAEGIECIDDPTFTCEARPVACGVPSSVDCACAIALCPSGGRCTSATQGEVDCEVDVP